MFKPAVKNAFREAAYKAQTELDCFEKTIDAAVKVTVAEVVGSCLPKKLVDAELSWQSIKCSVFDDSNMEID